MMRRTMRRLRSIALLACALAAPCPRTARAQAEVEPACRTDYAITARVDEAARRLIGEEVVLFRNEMNYFDPAARRQVLRTLHDKLTPGGYLLLGHSENLLNLSADFELVHLRSDLVYRRPEALAGTGGRA